MSSNQSIQWGIIGCGKIAQKFAEDLQSVPNATLHAVASRDQEKAKRFGDEFKSTVSYGSYEALVKDPDVEVIYIATPHVFHYENTILCLNHKKAVLCEKPFAMNLKQVTKMIEVARSNNVFLMEALWTYFLPHYRYVLELIQSKELGEVKNLEADFGFSAPFDPNGRIFNKSLGGGSILDVGIYPLFAALSLIGYPDSVKAEAEIGDTGVDHKCRMILKYQNDVEANLFSAITQQTQTTAKIELEYGTIMINSRFHEPSSVTIKKEGNTELFEFPVTTNGYNFEAEHVQQMLLQKRTESDSMTFEKSLQLIKLLDTVRNEVGLQY